MSLRHSPPTVYDRAYSSAPICVPARAALLTGLTPLRSGVLSNHQWLRPDLKMMGMKTWPDVLRDIGYRTAAVGKMHFHPFALMVGFPGSQEYCRNFLETHMRAWHALDYTTFTEEERKNIRVQYAGNVKQLDDEIGRIIRACKEKGIWDNTLIIVSSDHGDHVGDREMVGKSDYFEESIRVPLIFKAPAQTEGRRLNSLVELQQIPPTLIKYAGAEIPAWWDYEPLYEDEREDAFSYGVISNCCMVRKGPWKLVDYDAGFSELYHLDSDPQELNNRIDDPECQHIRIEYGEALRKWIHKQSFRAHEDKFLMADGGLSEDFSFARRGWVWDYPDPAFKGLL
ncbi:MAG: sulfatase-like hydrolase/transferase [Kiritimatiellales bacterium]